LERGGLPGAVRAQQSDDLAFVDDEVDAHHGLDRAVGDVQAA
jgi:hypothetical protein